MNVRSIPSARTLLTGLGAILLLVSASCRDNPSPTDPLAPQVAKAVLSPSTPFVNSLADPGDGVCDLTECTLREAIAYAQSDGATITFVPGLTGTITLVNGSLEIMYKGTLTIQGPGAESLTIVGNGKVPVFTTSFGTTTLSDMTITGGGNADPSGAGGGIYAWSGSLHVLRVMITGNTAAEAGGGIGSDWAQVFITESTISNNTARSGGGVFVTDGSLTLTRSTVKTNSTTVSGGGGGIATARAGSVTLTDCLFANNQSDASGGGASLHSNVVRVERCTFVGNSVNNSMSAGGALTLLGGETDPVATVVNSTFSGNTAWRGAAIHNYAATTSISQVTITGNPSTGTYGYGLGVGALTSGRTPISVKGSIIWGNTGGDVAIDGIEIYPYTSLGYNLVGAAGENVTLSSIFNQTGDQIGVTDAKLGPLDLNSPGSTPTHALLEGSPAIDAGICTDAGGNTLATDQRGVSRPQGDACDIGAYEMGVTVINGPVVNTLADHDDGSCDAPGTDSDCTLREAIAYGVAGDEITFASALTGTITLAGTELTIARNLTITGPGAATLSVSGNHASRVFSINSGATVHISGLTITAGYTSTYAGGIDNADGTLTLENCAVSGNDTEGFGGGVYNQWGATLIIVNCAVSGNTAYEGGAIYNEYAMSVTVSTISGNRAEYGGGIYMYAGSDNEIVGVVDNSVVKENVASEWGGGINNNGGRLTIIETWITDNRAENTDGSGVGIGGGILSSGKPPTAGLTVLHSTISGNTASDWGGGIYSYAEGSVATSPHAIVLNSTISGNTSHFLGGGFANGGGLAVLALSTITGNHGDAAGGGIYQDADLVRTDLKGTIAWGNTSGSGTPVSDDLAGKASPSGFSSLGNNLIGAAGVNVVLADVFSTAAGDLTGVATAGLGTLADNGGPTPTHALLTGSLAIDAGTCTDEAGTLVGYDQRGEPRPQGLGCDIGSYESSEGSGLEDPGFSFVLSGLAKTYGDAPFDVSGYAGTSAGSKGAIYFGTAPGSVGCSVTNAGLVTLTGAATGDDLCRVTAYIASDGTYASAGPVEQGFAIGRASLTVTAENETTTFGETPSFGVTYAGFVGSDDAVGLGGTLAYEFAGISPTTYAPSADVPTNAGTYSITPGGLTAYDYDITFVAGRFTIDKAAGSISIDNIPAEPRGGGSFTPTYATNSDGTRWVTSRTTDVCTVGAGVVTFLEDGGTCTLVASVAEGTNHLAATGDDQTFEVAPDILPPEEALPELIALSEEAGLSRGTVNKLRDVLKHWLAGRLTAAVSNLEDYIEDVQAQAGKKITAEDAAALVAAAQEIIDTILAAS